jgi:hypothetical protein
MTQEPPSLPKLDIKKAMCFPELTGRSGFMFWTTNKLGSGSDSCIYVLHTSDMEKKTTKSVIAGAHG